MRKYQSQVGRRSTKPLTGFFKSCQAHERQGKTEDPSQIGGGEIDKGGMTTKCNWDPGLAPGTEKGNVFFLCHQWKNW